MEQVLFCPLSHLSSCSHFFYAQTPMVLFPKKISNAFPEARGIFIQQIFKYLLCSRTCAKTQGYNRKQETAPPTCPPGTYNFIEAERKQVGEQTS